MTMQHIMLILIALAVGIIIGSELNAPNAPFDCVLVGTLDTNN